MEAMQKDRGSSAARNRVNTLIAAAVVMGAAAASAVQAEPAGETPLVSCMVQRASPQNKETVANAVQQSAYCPPSQLHPTESLGCPTGEKDRLLVKRLVFELARECSREFPSRASLPDIEASFMESLGKDTVVKALIEKRKAAHEKSKGDFERAHPVKDVKTSSGK